MKKRLERVSFSAFYIVFFAVFFVPVVTGFVLGVVVFVESVHAGHQEENTNNGEYDRKCDDEKIILARAQLVEDLVCGVRKIDTGQHSDYVRGSGGPFQPFNEFFFFKDR